MIIKIVVSLGLPPALIHMSCYRDHFPTQFVALFMKELYRLLRIKAASSNTYHLQTDGQTEWVNQELEQYIQIFARECQDD